MLTASGWGSASEPDLETDNNLLTRQGWWHKIKMAPWLCLGSNASHRKRQSNRATLVGVLTTRPCANPILLLFGQWAVRSNQSRTLGPSCGCQSEATTRIRCLDVPSWSSTRDPTSDRQPDQSGGGLPGQLLLPPWSTGSLEPMAGQLCFLPSPERKRGDSR